ncbi:MAG: hypothetical protein ACI4KA_06075 [Oscillospiraceae bacterium]
MKTVITDNSLCTLPVSDTAKSEHIYKYIEAMGEAGIKHVELDFRTIMKVRELPANMKYVFRLGDPMFAELANVFDFSYMLVTLKELNQKIKIPDIPVILELPATVSPNRKLLQLAQEQLSSKIAMVRLRGSFSLMKPQAARDFVIKCKSSVPVPIDICPMNKFRTALDCALKFSAARVDNLTMCMGLPKSYASIEEFLFSLMSIQETMPEQFNMAAICKATVYHQIIFGGSAADSISYIMGMLDRDIFQLVNVDTGKRVPMRMSLKDKMLLQKNFVSALEKFIDTEGIPDDFAYDICEAIKRYDASLYDTGLLYDKQPKKPLN